MGQWEWIIILLIVLAIGGREWLSIRRAVRQDKADAVRRQSQASTPTKE